MGYDILNHEQETVSKLTDDVNIAILMNKTTGQLQEHLRLNAVSLTQFV
jgi:hypothetical protein